MAGRTITQRIALDGGAEIKAQLEQIGAAGKAAFDRLSAAANQSEAFTKLGDTVAVLGTRFKALQSAAGDVGDSFGKFESSIVSVGKRLAVFTGAVGGAVAGVGALFKNAGDRAEDLQNEADALGVTSEKYGALKKAADLSGVGESLFKSMTTLAKATGDAGKASDDYRKKLNALNRDQAAGRLSYEQYNERLLELRQTTADTSNVFRELGVSIRNPDGSLRDLMEIFKDTSDALAGLPEGIDKTNKSMALFGTRNAKFGAFASQGAAGIEKMTLAAQRLTPELDQKGRAAVDRVSDSFKTLKNASVATSDQILAVFAPNVSAIVEAFTEKVANGRAAWVNYAKTIEARVKPIVDDIVALLEGRDADVKNSFIVKARDAMIDFGTAAKNAITNIVVPAVVALVSVLQVVADGINAVFGTKLTGGQIAIAVIITKMIGLFGVFASAIKLAWSAGVLLFRSMSVLTGSIGVLARVVGVVVAAFGAVPLAIAAVGFAVGFLVVTIVQKLGGVTGIVAKVQAAFGTFATFVQGVAVSIGTFFANAWAGLLNQISFFVASVIAWFARIPTTLGIIFGAIATAANAAWKAVSDGAGALWKILTDGFKAAVDAVVSFFTTTLPDKIKEAFNGLAETLKGAWDSLKKGASDAVNWIVNGFKSGLDAVTNYFSSLATRAGEILKSIMASVNSVAAAVSSAGGGGNAQKPPGFASGGHVRGRGTGRSDSIWARVSNGEFVQQYAAVRKYGVAFMNALNQGRISVGRIREVMSGVDLGGIAHGMTESLMPGVPRFRDGGLVNEAIGGGGKLHPVTVNFGGQSFQMAAAPDVVGQMQRYAAGKALRSAGRAPNWVR